MQGRLSAAGLLLAASFTMVALPGVALVRAEDNAPGEVREKGGKSDGKASDDASEAELLKKIKRFVGYRPQVSLDRLLETTIRDHCERMGVPCPIEVPAA